MDINLRARPIGERPFSRSKVDIIIPFHAQYERVSALVRSILVSVKSNPYQITLVDDCSDNESFGEEIEKEFSKNTPQGYKPQLRYIRNEKQVGFGGALRAGFEATEHPWVLFMHSDCVVEDPNFMIDLGNSLLSWKNQGVPVKMVSARSNNPGDCDEARAGRLDKGDKDIVLDGVTMPLFCAMCNRDLFRHIGGFIKEYPFAWYEDEELAHRMRSRGFLQGVSSKAWIYHHGASTVRYMWENRPESREVMESNRERCIEDIRRVSTSR
jgi:GT2 family glycosyltransferase